MSDVLLVDNISPREVSITPTPANEYTEIVSFDKGKRVVMGVATYEKVDDYDTMLSVKTMNLTRFNTVFYDHKAPGFTCCTVSNRKHCTCTKNNG